jgi:hypothetical protein
MYEGPKDAWGHHQGGYGAAAGGQGAWGMGQMQGMQAVIHSKKKNLNPFIYSHVRFVV